MKSILLVGVLLTMAAVGRAQQPPDPRDSVILESKTLAPGYYPGGASDTAAYVYFKVSITNKDTLANLTLPVEIRSLYGDAFAVLGYPRNFAGTMSRLTSTLGNSLTFSSFANSASPDSALWAGFWDPTDTATAEPPNAFRKAFWELKFDSVRTNSFPGAVQIDSAVTFDTRVGFVSINGSSAEVNFVRGIVFVDHPGCDLIINCRGANGNILFGRSFTFDFDADCPGKWSVVTGPGTIDSLNGIYSLPGQCGLGAEAVTVRYRSDFFTFTDCGFVLNVIDKPPSCSPAQNTITVSHGQTATNQIIAADPDAGDGFVFTKLSGPGTVNPNGVWSYTTGCEDVPVSPQTIKIKVSDAFGSCYPGPRADSCQFQLVVTNAPPVIIWPASTPK